MSYGAVSLNQSLAGWFLACMELILNCVQNVFLCEYEFNLLIVLILMNQQSFGHFKHSHSTKFALHLENVNDFVKLICAANIKRYYRHR